MTAPSPAAELRAAAAKVRADASRTRWSPWMCEQGSDEAPGIGAYEWWHVVGCNEVDVASLNSLDIGAAQANAECIALLSPAVAEPLAAWLEWAADEQDERTEGCVECRGTGEVFDGDPVGFDCTGCVARRPLALARVLLGGAS